MILVRHGEDVCGRNFSKGAKYPSFTAAEITSSTGLVARDESRISRAPGRPALVGLSASVCKPVAPSSHPIVEGARYWSTGCAPRVAVETVFEKTAGGRSR